MAKKRIGSSHHLTHPRISMGSPMYKDHGYVVGSENGTLTYPVWPYWPQGVLRIDNCRSQIWSRIGMGV